MPAQRLFRLNRLYKTLLLCLLLVPFAAARGNDHDWRYEETRSDSREFVAGGTFHVHMKVGDLHIKRGDADKIRLTYTVKSRHERNVKEARADLSVHGNDATLELSVPSTSNTQFDVELEVPPNTNLDVHQKVGDLSVDSVEGNKDLELGVGDIHLTPERAGYRMVRASTGIGDVNSNGYGETSGWLGKTLRYRGEGKYELRAYVGVGDITLEPK